MTIIETRLDELEMISLKPGNHSEDSGGMCFLEAVAWVVGESWTDHPSCVDPVLANFGRSWNDSLPDDETRDRLLKPFIPRLVGTVAGDEIQDRRAFLAADWIVRVFTPSWLRLANLNDHADLVAGLPPLDSDAACKAAAPTLAAARNAARRAAAAGTSARTSSWAAAVAATATIAAAGEAAWAAAAGAAAGDAAGDAGGDAAWTAAAAGTAVAGNAAWAAAGTRMRAGDAAEAALQSTVVELQQSAIDLFDQMIALTEVSR